MSPTGMFCCIVPDATDTDQTVCANIGESIMVLHVHGHRAAAVYTALVVSELVKIVPFAFV